MADGKIEIDTGINTTGAQKDIKGLKGILDKVGNSSTVKGIANLGMSFGAVGTAAKVVIGAVQKVSQTVKELTDAYKVQEKAEVQLETAAKNNPYLDSSSVKALKNYASELQSVSTYGDEQLIPMMATLAASGRTQSEIMDIMSASVDVAASGSMSLESAVRNLNKTYGGLSGELGETIPQIKALTAEQLKDGEAVKVVAGQYKGMAEEVAKATGTSEQLQNAVGDLKEEFGASFEKGLGPVRSFFTELISGWAEAKKAKREYEEAVEANAREETTTKQTLLTQLETEQKHYDEINEKITEMANDLKGGSYIVQGYDLTEITKKALQTTRENLREQDLLIKAIKERIKLAEEIEKKDLAKAQADAKEAERIANINSRNQKALDHINATTQAREKQLKTIQLTAELEEHAGNAQKELADQQSRLNAYAQSYVSLVAESGGLISENNPVAKQLFETVQEMTKEYQEQVQLQEEASLSESEKKKKAQEELELRKKLKEEAEELIKETLDEEVDTYDQKIKLLEDYRDQYLNTERDLSEEEIAIREKTEEAILKLKQDAEEAKKQATLDSLSSMLSTANDFASQYSSIITDLSSLVCEQAENEATVKKAELQEQLAAGTISEEEAAARTLEIEKETAQKEYKMKMWEWSASLAQATANTALAIVNSLKEGGALGIAMAALVGAAGAVQLATIISNKPIPPSYATGGIVPGSSYSGDRVQANVNSGEMILNSAQQKALWNTANGASSGSRGTSVKIYNSASNEVSARPEMTEDGLKLVVSKIVTKEMSDGKYNRALQSANSTMNGVRLTN